MSTHTHAMQHRDDQSAIALQLARIFRFRFQIRSAQFDMCAFIDSPSDIISAVNWMWPSLARVKEQATRRSFPLPVYPAFTSHYLCSRACNWVQLNQLGRLLIAPVWHSYGSYRSSNQSTCRGKSERSEFLCKPFGIQNRHWTTSRHYECIACGLTKYEAHTRITPS